jgi:hypothetical protein
MTQSKADDRTARREQIKALVDDHGMSWQDAADIIGRVEGRAKRDAKREAAKK